ncbi:MAG: HEAT repeat domain-containing protein [Candidatus ainarchaeum sp.]|nr:HEAT repeat domain-containing protein [Candidatus ainarchaeum sp.]
MSNRDLQKLISMTFDEDPEVRKRTAKKLSILDDPGALFALIELSYDKDDSVRDTVKRILEKKQSQKTEDILSFSELFSYKEDVQSPVSEEEQSDKKKRLLHPIELIFERRLGSKSEIVKKKMMPSLEKVYLKAVSKNGPASETERKSAVQEFLTTYLDAISDINSSSETSFIKETIKEKIECRDTIDSLEALEHVSSKSSLDEEHINSILKEADELLPNSEEEQETFLKDAPDSIFKKAYELMMYSGGDIKLMKKEMKRMMRNAERDIKLAFRLASQKFREHKLTKITEIREKMRNIYTDDLLIISKEPIEFKKPRSSTNALRILVEDPQGNEGVIYLFDGRGETLSKGMKIKIEKGYAKVINDETALTIGSSGRVYIVV